MRQRLDLLVVERGLAESREKAKAYIMSGCVFVNGQREDKAGASFESEAIIELVGKTDSDFVSRGGKKLEKAMAEFGLTLDGLVCADIGASTGGFTDCMLRHGAVKVFAVDVGYGQLAWKLRNDERVVCLERTNARYLTNEQITEPLNFFSVDVSFISLKLILPAVSGLLSQNAHGVCLIKPQFEAGRAQVGKKGVVRDEAVHIQVIQNVLGYISDNSLYCAGLTYSPIKGPQGNIEYLVYITNVKTESIQPNAEETVKLAHLELDKKATEE